MEEKKNAGMELDPEELSSLSGGFDNTTPAWNPFIPNGNPSQEPQGGDGTEVNNTRTATADPDQNNEYTATQARPS